mgnify:CR=1 FL=1
MTDTSVTLIKVRVSKSSFTLTDVDILDEPQLPSEVSAPEPVPTPEPVEGAQPFRRKISGWNGTPGCRIKSYMYATLWDGKPQSGTSYY